MSGLVRYDIDMEWSGSELYDDRKIGRKETWTE